MGTVTGPFGRTVKWQCFKNILASVGNELCLRSGVIRRAAGTWIGGRCRCPEQRWQWFEQVCQHWRWFCLLSYRFSGFAFTRFGNALPLAQQNVMPVLAAFLFRSPKMYNSMHQLQSLSFKQHWINLCSPWFLLTFYLSGMDLFVCLVGWS